MSVTGQPRVERSRTSLRRRLQKSGSGRWLLRTRPARWVVTRRRQRVTRQLARDEPDRFAGVHSCVLLIGHVKSGGTLLGAMLDAHPEIAFADEVDVVAQLAAGLDREQVFHLITRASRREALGGRVTARRLEPYSLSIPGQWQGRETTLRVVGDSRAGPTTRALGDHPAQLVALETALAPARVVFVHVVRNPFEPIGAMVRRSGRTVSDAVADHRAQCERLIRIRARLSPECLYTVRYEDLVARPADHLRGLLSLLDVEIRDDHLAACGALVQRGPARDRDRIPWTADDLEAVRATIERIDFLAGYGFDT